MSFTLILDKTALLFIPPSSDKACRFPPPSVVQVIIKPARSVEWVCLRIVAILNHERSKHTQNEAVAFAAVQGEITVRGAIG